MANILITGGEGVLGSSLSDLFLKLGDDVTVIDIVRRDECWRLQRLGIVDHVDYRGKGSQDLETKDVEDADLVVDCAIGFPDRPFGTTSPRASIDANIAPAVGLLEALRHSSHKPVVIYPSSFNSMYGNKGTYDERTSTNPTSIYGWTKSAAEQLYRTYHTSFGIPVIITRVGSSYGEMMRTDELVAKLILAAINKKKFLMRSPLSRRLWTYLGDVINAYKAIIQQSDYGHDPEFMEPIESEGLALNVAGNLNDQILNNLELGELISGLIGNRIEVTPMDYYEPGEMVNGSPIDFGIDAEWTRNLLGWRPDFTLNSGLERTTKWFSENATMVIG